MTLNNPKSLTARRPRVSARNHRQRNHYDHAITEGSLMNESGFLILSLRPSPLARQAVDRGVPVGEYTLQTPA